MNIQLGYQKQQKLSFAQLLGEIPDFITRFISMILSKSLLAVVDLFDSFGQLVKSCTTAILSKKLSKDLRFEYNYGIGKIEAISALLCESVIMLGILLTVGLSVYKLIIPSKPNNFLLFAVGLKVLHVCTDTFYLIKQRKITKEYNGPIIKSNYAATLTMLWFDSITLLSFLIVWLFRNNPGGKYITPVITIIIAIYLLIGCIKRIKFAIGEITDKTLPEEAQLKIVSVLTRFHTRYSDFYAVKSRKCGDCLLVDLHLAFTPDTTFEEIVNFRQDVQNALNESFENCTVDIVIRKVEESQ